MKQRFQPFSTLILLSGVTNSNFFFILSCLIRFTRKAIRAINVRASKPISEHVCVSDVCPSEHISSSHVRSSNIVSANNIRPGKIATATTIYKILESNSSFHVK